MENTNGYKHYTREVIEHGQRVTGLCGVIRAETMRADMNSYASAGFWTCNDMKTGQAWATDNRGRRVTYTPLAY